MKKSLLYFPLNLVLHLSHQHAIQTEGDPETLGPCEPWPHLHWQAQESPGRLRSCWWLASSQDQLQQIPPRLLWESWYEALPLKEEPELLTHCQPRYTVDLGQWANTGKCCQKQDWSCSHHWRGTMRLLQSSREEKAPKAACHCEGQILQLHAEKIKSVGGACVLVAWSHTEGISLNAHKWKKKFTHSDVVFPLWSSQLPSVLSFYLEGSS